MGKGNPFKAITKPIESAAKSVSKAVGNVIEAPFNVASGVVNGDVDKVLNGAAKAASMGTVSYNKSGGGIVNATDTVSNVVGSLTGANAMADAINNQTASAAAQEKAAAAQEKAAAAALAQQQADAKAAAISRRRADLEGDTRTIYTTALGDVANSAKGKTRKKTVLGG